MTELNLSSPLSSLSSVSTGSSPSTSTQTVSTPTPTTSVPTTTATTKVASVPIPNGTQTVTTVTNTTTVDTTYTAVSDVSYIPFMRKLDIDFIGYGLRPSREIYHWFDGKNIQQYIERLNVITLDTKKPFKDFTSGPREQVLVGGSNATVFLNETDPNTGNTKLFVNHLVKALRNPTAGNTITGLTSGVSGNVVSYLHRSGIAGSSSNSSYIYFANDADTGNDNVYVSNTITLVTGPSAGQSANIISYNAASRIAHVSPSFGTVGSNTIYSIGDKKQPYSVNAVQGTWTTSKGFDVGTFHLPDPSANAEYRFLTGQRIFRILDNPRDDLNDYTTRADYSFTSNGLDISTTQIVVRSTSSNTTTTIANTVVTQPTVKVTPPVASSGSSSGKGGNGATGSAGNNPNATANPNDPIAQSFYVDPLIHPAGIFVPSIQLYFANKDPIVPVQVQIRPMTGGYPDSSVVLPGAICIIQPEDVVTTTAPDTTNIATATVFTFPSPVYLLAGYSYAFVVLTDSYAYDIYCSELGQEILGTNRIVSTQPFLGSMFKSQAAVTYTAIQSDDIMFVINQCVFGSAGSVVFTEAKDPNPSTTGNTLVDILQVHSDAAQLPSTSVGYQFKATSNSNNALDSVYTSFTPDLDYLLNTRKVIYGADVVTPSFFNQITMTTSNPDVSPIIFKNRQQAIGVENRINNLGLTNLIVTIANTGSNYFGTNTSLTFVSANGSGANGYITTNAATLGIDSVIIDNPGFGYNDNVTVTITSSTGTNGSILVATETGKSGGPGQFRYISDTVTLADNFDGGDLRVFLTAVKPQNASIDVYYKVRNILDQESIDDKYWKHMVQVTAAEIISLNTYDPIEYQYTPSLTSNNVTYSTNNATYTTFQQFKIKIVGSATDTVDAVIPKILDMRAIALVADVF